MHGERILLVVLIVRVTLVSMQSSGSDEISVQCPPNGRVNLTGETPDQASGFMVKSGYIFPPESVWTEGNETFGCVCYSRPICYPVYCPSGTDMYLKIDRDCNKDFFYWYEFVPDFAVYSRKVLNKSIIVTTDEIQMESKYGICEWMDTEVESVKFPKNGFLLRNDGSIYMQQKNISATFNFDRFCLCNSISFRIAKPTCLDEEETISVGCNKQSVDLFLNLLIVMGIKWSMVFSL